MKYLVSKIFRRTYHTMAGPIVNFSTETTNANSSDSGSYFVGRKVGRATIALGATNVVVPWPYPVAPTANALVLVTVQGAAPDATALSFAVSFQAGPPATFTITADAASTAAVNLAYAILQS